jgi:hypothetical protein
MTNQTVVPLVLSSAFFTIPGIYGYQKGHIGLSVCSFLNATISTLFWLNPVEGVIRDLDLTISTLSFFFFAYYGFRGAYKDPKPPEKISDIILGQILSMTLYGSFKTACWLYHIGDPFWVWYHFAFHVQTIYLQTKAVQYAE